MKNISQNIITLLNTSSFLNNLESLKTSNANYEAQEITILEVCERLYDIRNVLLDSIDSGLFENLPFNLRTAIHTQLSNVIRYSGSPDQLIPQYSALEVTIYNSRLFELSIGKTDFLERAKEINSLRRKYKKLLSDIEETENIKNSISEILKEVDENSEIIENVTKKATLFDEVLNRDGISIKEKMKSISDAEQEIENRKKEIIAFGINIEKNQEKLKIIYDDISLKIEKELNTQIKKAKDLIKEAENALELKQTEGIAKAYSSRLNKITTSKSKKYWLIGAIVFILITLVFGYLITGGQISLWKLNIGFKASENIGFIIGRIILTFIGISGAVFCANRFVLLRNIEEDYEYKVVLTKSILAFSNKIKEIDKTKVADYLTQVLKELHQDPLRNRKSFNKGENKLSIDNVKVIAELLNKFKVN